MLLHVVHTPLVLLVACLCMDTATALTIDIQPSVYTMESTGPVNISCRPDGQEKEVLMMEITRNGGGPIVILRATSGISYGKGGFDASKMRVDGVIDQDPSQTYLRLSIPTPARDDRGVYTCVMFFSDDVGYLLERRASRNLTIDNLGVQDFLDEISSLKRELGDLKTRDFILQNTVDTLQNDNKNLARVVAGCHGNESKLKVKVEALQDENNKMSRIISEYHDNATYSVSFSATLDHKLEPSQGDVVIYPIVRSNPGLGYDPSTGVFTAPVAGVYWFHLYASTYCQGCVVYLSVTSDDVALFELTVSKSEFRGQSAILQQGAKVKVEVTRTRYDAALFGDNIANLFSGQLIWQTSP